MARNADQTRDAAAWDQRYAETDLVWSLTPNQWVVQELSSLTPGRAIDIAAGEGRNAIWLAERGWHVTAYDFSEVATQRMHQLADARLTDRRDHLSIGVADATEPLPDPDADLVLFSYLHLPPEQWHRALAHGVAGTAPGGTVLVIAHAKKNLTEGVGGPQDPEILLDPDDVVRSAAELPVTIDFAELRQRSTPQGIALDTVVRLRRSA